MRNLSDHDIDQLFKDAAGQNQPEFDPADWEMMERRLVGSPWWLESGKWFGGVVVIGVLISSLWFASGSKSNEVSNDDSNIVQPMNTIETSKQSGSSLSDVHRDNHVASSDQKAIVEDKVDRRIRSSRNQYVNRESEGNSGSGSLHDNTAASNEQKAIAERDAGRRIRSSRNHSVNSISAQTNQQAEIAEGAGKFQSSGKSGDAVAVTSDESLINSNAKVATAKTSDEISSNTKSSVGIALSGTEVFAANSDTAEDENPLGVTATVSPLEEHSPDINTENSAMDKENSTDSVLVYEKSPVRKRGMDEEAKDSTLTAPSFARMAVRLKASPDFSSENFAESGKTGINYGFEVEYFISGHVSLSAGLIRSRKYYDVHDATYMDFVGLDIDGDCAMWDIPLNVNYYATPSRQYSFFASAGFSSYLMSEENYQFQVTTPGYQGPETNTYSKQVRNENQEWFKILNVSIGVQRRINRNFALQIEPFIKVPLAEVGSSNVSLSSFGTYLSLRYNLLFR